MEIAPQLCVVRNFLSLDEINLFLDFFNTRCNWSQPIGADYRERQHHSSDPTEYRGNPDFEDIFSSYQNIASRKKSCLESFFGETLAQPLNMAFRKWVPGDYQSAHSDVGHPDGTLIVHPPREETGPLSLHQYDIAAVLYFNDDFDGGEIYFSSYGIEVKPEPGMLVGFPASHHYLHGVSEVRSGTRYVQTSFWPYSRTIIHNLIPGIPSNWWKKFVNSEEILSFIPKEILESLDKQFLPPQMR